MGSPIGTPATVEVDPGATSVTIPATNLAGIGNYELSKDYTLGTDGTLVLPLTDGQTSVTLKYTLKQASITVKSVDENGKEIGTETQSDVIGTKTDIEAPKINGYTVKSDNMKTVIFGTDTEITFTYKKNASPAPTDPTNPTNPTDPDTTNPTDPNPTDPDTTNPTTPTDPERPTLPITGGETGGNQEQPTTDPVTGTTDPTNPTGPTTAVKPILPATGVTTKTTLPQTGERHHVLAAWLSAAGVALAGVAAVAVIVTRKRRD
ncbi:MucBP domain-containing protein [Lapidilactobacillus achengensis]|nr:MucBP domain-containing protein [Lapidilactobacillus achengensis]